MFKFINNMIDRNSYNTAIKEYNKKKIQFDLAIADLLLNPRFNLDYNRKDNCFEFHYTLPSQLIDLYSYVCGKYGNCESDARTDNTHGMSIYFGCATIRIACYKDVTK